jgi:hypothetical protein
MRFIGNAPVDGEVRAIASGALATGEAVVVNSDGTVSAVAGSDQVLSSPTVFRSASTQSITSTFDSNSNKVVIAYRDAGNSGYGTAIVATISGSSVSFGSPTVFDSDGANDLSIDFDTTANKFVVAYNRTTGSNLGGRAVVGTVSGTSISFGSSVLVDSGLTTTIQNTTTRYDSSTNKTVVVLKDGGNNDNSYAYVGTISGTSISFGSSTLLANSTGNTLLSTYDSNSNKVVVGYSGGKVKVGTVSGTSISFGSEVDFTSNTQIYMGMTFDSINNKVVIAYGDYTTDTGKAVVGTVSGTSISFGSLVTFNAVTADISATFDSNQGKVIIAYRDASNSQYGTVISGTVSGTSISFDNEVVFESARCEYISASYDSNAQRSLISYQDGGNSNYGEAVVFRPGSTNLTSENFVGFANSGYASGQSAAINSTCMVDSNQTSLTAGQTYYVQTSGALGTTPGDPSVVAGTAISSKSIIVKG